jgi:predicted double-glycine peptidase
MYFCVSIYSYYAIVMRKTTRINQTHLSIDLPETIDNYMVLTFTNEQGNYSMHLVKFPKWWRFHDKKYRYYIFSYN